ncbi:UNVERIFIED_CONTAM: hypothetical protein PYX00_008582 [Menopon gallinae]|uniref:Dendritic cell-specific transmembrane protein-like domain-containing protein n=1 Tax=Menopon gallinae TaxID=328185 RepID=A0AAW2HPY7_9NEOP
MTYALYLSFTGPVHNMMHNMGILSDSMTCGQEMVRRTLRQIEDMVKAPFRAMKDTLTKIKKALQEAIDKTKTFFDNIKRIILSILYVIKKAVSWLGSIVNFCNKELGTPFQRCMKTLDDAIEDCKAKMGIMGFLCHVVHVVKALCYTVKFLDLICLFTEFVSDAIVGLVKRKLREFSTQIKNLFYVSVEFSHTYEHNLEASNSTKFIARTIIHEMTKKFEKLYKFFNLLGWGFSFFFILIFFRVYYYKYKYLSSDSYDNRYITSYIAELDLRRLKANRETILPLELRERKHYCSATSLRLLRSEVESILTTMLVLSLSTFQIAAFMLCDYGLYWVLFTIYHEGQKQVVQVEGAEIGLHVSGNGSLAKFYSNLGKALKIPKNPNLDVDPTHCLPDPIPPDKDKYMQIACLTGFCWILAVVEVYNLRLRNVVMSHYYPERAKERAVWLYNHILRSRGGFVKFARRQLRRKKRCAKGKRTEKITIKQRIFAKMPFLAKLFGQENEDACILCGTPKSKEEVLKKCATPGCGGKYCIKCFASLGNICTICQHPIEYGDITDISEEKDSSDESFEELMRHKMRDSYPSDDEGTFKSRETRPKFRDLERNLKIDFAQKSDFGRIKLKGKLTPSQVHALKEKAAQLLSGLQNQRMDDREKRKKEIMEDLRRRLQEKNGEKDKQYESMLGKARKLSQNLVRRKSMIAEAEADGEEQKPLLPEKCEDNISYDRIKDKQHELMLGRARTSSQNLVRRESLIAEAEADGERQKPLHPEKCEDNISYDRIKDKQHELMLGRARTSSQNLVRRESMIAEAEADGERQKALHPEKCEDNISYDRIKDKQHELMLGRARTSSQNLVRRES